MNNADSGYSFVHDGVCEALRHSSASAIGCAVDSVTDVASWSGASEASGRRGRLQRLRLLQTQDPTQDQGQDEQDELAISSASLGADRTEVAIAFSMSYANAKTGTAARSEFKALNGGDGITDTL